MSPRKRRKKRQKKDSRERRKERDRRQEEKRERERDGAVCANPEPGGLSTGGGGLELNSINSNT
jgi:hypothetical protein